MAFMICNAYLFSVRMIVVKFRSHLGRKNGAIVRNVIRCRLGKMERKSNEKELSLNFESHYNNIELKTSVGSSFSYANCR